MSAPDSYSDPRKGAYLREVAGRRDDHKGRDDVARLLRTSVHAAVDAEKLTRGIEWHNFQQLLQAGLDKAREDLMKIGPALMDPDVTSHEDLLKLKQRGMILNERIETLTLVLALPKQVEENGLDARRALEEAKWLEPPPSD